MLYFNKEGDKFMTPCVLITDSASRTFALGEHLGELLKPGDVLCVSGELGTGKTVLAQGIAKGLGVKERVTSPTFTLINEYQGNISFYHMDVYRLKGSSDMADLGYEEYLYGQGVTFIEWADRIEEVLPQERLDILIKSVPGEDDAREINFFAHGERYCHLVKELDEIVRFRY